MSTPIGTTPTFSLLFDENDVDFTTAENVYVSLVSPYAEYVKTGDEIYVAAHQIDVSLTQAETLALGSGNVAIQANWTYGNGNRAASEIVRYRLGENLLERVVS